MNTVVKTIMITAIIAPFAFGFGAVLGKFYHKRNVPIEAIKTDETTTLLPNGGKQKTTIFWTERGPIFWVQEVEE